MSMNNPKLLDTCKVVYVARNPKDACVSFFNHCRLIKLVDFSGDLEVRPPHSVCAIAHYGTVQGATNLSHVK